MPSAPQTVATSVVFDYILDTAGVPVVGARVDCILNFNQSVVASPAVSIGPIQQTTITDQNGYFQFVLVSNQNISPINTTYTIRTQYNTYDITVGTAGPYQTTAVGTIVSVPTPLAPATTNLTGPITVTGNETVTGALVVSGTTTLGGTTTGPLTVGSTELVQGDLTIAAAFRLLFGAAVAKIIPGATSLSLRNNADALDNLLVTDAGILTARNDMILSAGRLLIQAAAAKILGGATSLSLRNNADSADNLLVSDAGLITHRNAILVPPVAGGTLAPTSYGTVPVKLAELIAGGASSSFVFASIPGGFRNLILRFNGTTTNAAAQGVLLQFNGDTGANYYSNLFESSNTTALSESLAATSGDAGSSASSSVANLGCGTIVIYDYARTTWRKAWTYQSFRLDSGAAGTSHSQFGGGLWVSTAVLTQIGLLVAAGFWSSGSIAELWGEP